MAHRICYPITNVDARFIITVTTPDGGLKPGDVVVVNTIDNTILNNFTQYVAAKPTTALLPTEDLGIVISGGSFDELSDGRYPNGNPDYTQYEYFKGETAPVLLLEPRVKFYISNDCLDGAPTVGQYLYGQNNSNTLTYGDNVPTVNLTVAKVQAKHNFRLGGIFGGEFATGNICRVLPYVDVVDYYTVTFNTNGGSEIASQSVIEGRTATRPETNPTKDGYNFKDWYANQTLTTLFDFSTPINENTTIYAKWVEVFTVTFNSNGGSEITSQSIEDGGLVTKPTDPTKENYTFNGWYKEDTLETEFNFTTDTITEDTTLYAKWTE